MNLKPEEAVHIHDPSRAPKGKDTAELPSRDGVQMLSVLKWVRREGQQRAFSPLSPGSPLDFPSSFLQELLI